MNKRNFIAVSIGLVLAKMLSPFKSFSMNKKQTPTWRSFKIDDINQKRLSEGGPYLSFLNEKSLKTGLYVLPKGTEDKQNPHDLDEVYYVIEGRSKFFVDGDTVDVSPGDVLYVKAQIEHRFKEITEDLKILVFFSEFKVS